jgi:hypothetical protein
MCSTLYHLRPARLRAGSGTSCCPHPAKARAKETAAWGLASAMAGSAQGTALAQAHQRVQEAPLRPAVQAGRVAPEVQVAQGGQQVQVQAQEKGCYHRL